MAGRVRITTRETFDGLPMFSPDGKPLVFASSRGGSRPGEASLLIADGVERAAQTGESPGQAPGGARRIAE